MAKLITLLLLLWLAGCSTTEPISGTLGDGPSISGRASGHLDGSGEFSVQIPGGPTCTGTFSGRLNLLGPARATSIAKCDDGASAEAVIYRGPTGTPRSADLTLSNHKTIHVVFENVESVPTK